MKPSTQYTKSGRINIAYQVFGSGPVDLVYIPGWVSNIDWMWACPELVHFLTELSKIARVVLFDKRGTGLSDRVVELSTLEERMDDIRAVMDAIGSKQAILFGHSEGGCVSALFAATYPNRVLGLIAFGIFAKRRYAPNYPWAPTDEERQEVYDMIEHSWGSGDMNLATLAPSKANDDKFMDWLSNYFRSGASPSAALVLTRMNTEVDIVKILGSIQVPTLLMQRTGDIDVKIEEGRFIAGRINGARFVEFDGNDHLFWAGNTAEVLDEMKSFILTERPEKVYEERLFTILAARIESNGDKPIDPRARIGQSVAQYKGQVLTFEDNLLIAAFEGPSKAVHCGLDMVRGMSDIHVNLAVGIHIREVSLESHRINHGRTRKFCEMLLTQAKAGQIIITNSVKSLLSGAGLNFRQIQSVYRNISQMPQLLYVVTDHLTEEPREHSLKLNPSSKNDSFLENVLQVIDDHLGDELFGVDRICREVGTSERQLQRKLKAIANKSPNQMISSVRLHRARELLLEQKNNIAEVAFQTGFSSPSYFSRKFKQEFGMSPTNLIKTNNDP